MEATRTRKTRDRITPTHRAIAAVAKKQFEAEGRVTTGHIMKACGGTQEEIRARVRVLRTHGMFPWAVTRIVPPRERIYGGAEDRSDREANLALWFGRRQEILADARKGMGDGRAEIDDPREHGRLSVPRSLPRAKKAGEDDIYLWVREARRIRRRLGIGRKGRAA